MYSLIPISGHIDVEFTDWGWISTFRSPVAIHSYMNVDNMIKHESPTRGALQAIVLRLSSHTLGHDKLDAKNQDKADGRTG